MKPESLKTEEAGRTKNLSLATGVGISYSSFDQFIRNENNFTITTKSNEYKCNRYGVFSSKVIRELILKDPTTNTYNYDFDDENNEFQLICDIFNFQYVDITTNNMYSIKEMADDLQIDFIIPKLEKNIDESEKVSKMIDEHQTVVDTIEELFGQLYNIGQNTVESLKTTIVNSRWSKTEESVQELAAFIIQVVSKSIYFHPYIIDLMIQLDKASNETNKLNILIPFIIQKFFAYSIKIQRFSYCSFIYNLYKRGLVSKEDLNAKIAKCITQTAIIYWFLPEIIELNLFWRISSSVEMEDLQVSTFIKNYYPDNMDLYKKMRDSGEPDNELMKAIRIDDVDKVQSIVSSSNIDFSSCTLPLSIFDDFVDNGYMSVMNYAAAFGSIKCFKYLMLNHIDMNENTFKYAVHGGNIEIIKIVDQNPSLIPQASNKKKNKASKFDSLIENSGIITTIEMHKNDLFDWIFEHKFYDKIVDTSYLLLSSAKNGNAHSLIQLIDRSSTSCNFRQLIENTSDNGYYKLSKLIFDIMTKRSIEFQSASELNEQNRSENYSFARFGNLSIFKLGLKINNSDEYLISMLSCVITCKFKNIFDYCLDEIILDGSQITSSFIKIDLTEAIRNDDNYYFNRLIEKIKHLNPNAFKNYISFVELLLTCCRSKNIDYFKEILSITEENGIVIDMTKVFIEAARYKSKEICQYIIDKKKRINYQSISADSDTIGNLNVEIFSIILDNASPEMKEVFLSCFLSSAIKKKNKNLVEFLLSKDVRMDSALLDAVKINDLDIVDIILKKNSDPSYVNEKTSQGTALQIATNQNYLSIVKRLLQVPGIDLGLYGDTDQTPLITSIINLNLELMNAILDFYGDNIKSQTWQIDKAIRMTLTLLSTPSNRESFFSRRKSESIQKQKNKLLSILKIILEIENVDPNSYGGEHTLLSYACESNEIDIVQMLLKIDKIDVNSYAPINGTTPLMIALMNKNVEIAEILINDKRTNINARDYEDKTALTIACNNNMEAIVNLLIKHEKFNPDESCINYAFYISNYSISKLLLSSNESIDINYKYIKNTNIANSKSFRSNPQTHLDCITNFGNRFSTPLICAVQNKYNEKVKLIIQHPSFDKVKSQLNKAIFDSIRYHNIDAFDILLELVDNDINLMDENYYSLLVISANFNEISFVNEILEKDNFDPIKSDINNAFITSLLSFRDFADVANALYEYDQNHQHLIDVKSCFRRIAPYDNRNWNAKIDYLLNVIELDPNIPDSKGIYPLEYAIKYGNNDIVESLIRSEKVNLQQQIPIKPNVNNINTKSKYKTYMHLAARSNTLIIGLF